VLEVVMAAAMGRCEALSLLTDAKDDPSADLPRLLLADWLDDHGESDRAEFVRLQCRLVALDEADAGRESLRRRERELLDRHEADWLGPVLALPLESWSWRRGLLHLAVRGATIRSREFLGLVGGEALAWAEGLTLHEQTEHEMIRCLQSPVLREVNGLTLERACLNEAVADALEDCPHLGRLRFFTWHATGRYPSSIPSWDDRLDWVRRQNEQVFSLPVFRRVSRLKLRSRFLPPETLGPLDRLPELTELDVSHCGWVGGLRGLHRRDFFSRLTSFEAGYNDLMHEDLGQYGGENSIAALADSPNVANLRHLGLADNDLTRWDARRLIESPHLGRLTSLDLRDNKWRGVDKEAEALRARFGPGVRL
jgi:uncharacterized protein (TIGR02996 family)